MSLRIAALGARLTGESLATQLRWWQRDAFRVRNGYYCATGATLDRLGRWTSDQPCTILTGDEYYAVRQDIYALRVLAKQPEEQRALLALRDELDALMQATLLPQRLLMGRLHLLRWLREHGYSYEMANTLSSDEELRTLTLDRINALAEER